MTGGLVVVAVAAGTTAWGVTGGGGSSYRTARAAIGDVQQTLSATGSISAVHSAGADFQVAGTVKKLDTKVGERVRVGAVLARLDDSELTSALRSARSALASARTRLTADQTGQSSAAGSNALLSSRPTVSPSPAAQPSSGPTSAGGSGTLQRDQQAVRRGQQATDHALQLENRALAAVKADCAGTGSATGTPTPTPTPSNSATSSSCSTASAALYADQTAVSAAERALSDAEQALNQDLQRALASANSSNSSAGDGSQKSSAGGSGTTITAADIASDQSSIDQATAQVATAKADLRQATLRSPIAGRITAITISKGDRVTGNTSASSPAVQIVGSGQDQVAIALSDSEIGTVRVGMPAEVVPDGSSRSIVGRVAAITSAGTESSSGDVTYPVAVTIPRSRSLVMGAAAAVTVVVSTLHDVLTVPTSAVHRSGTTSYVELLSGHKEVRRTITVSAIGPARTAIRSGLDVGQRVVLAKLNQAVPSSSSNLTGRGGFSRGLGGVGGGPPGGGGTFTGPGGRSFVISP